MKKKKAKKENIKTAPNPPKAVNSLLDHMVDGREFESLLSLNIENLNLASEIRKSINEIQSIRKKGILHMSIKVVNTF